VLENFDWVPVRGKIV